MNYDKKTVSDKFWGWLPRDVNWWMVGIILACFGVFISAMLFDCISCLFQKWFGTETKKETLEFLGFGIGGVFALFGLVALNKRADAQIKTNKLTEIGLFQERFKAAVEHLSNQGESGRIASFYEFFYLAREKSDDYAQSILDILCAHLRRIADYKDNKNDDGVHPSQSKEVEALIGLLFGSNTGNVFYPYFFNFRGVNLSGFSFINAETHMKNIDFQYANLREAKLREIDLSGANLSETDLIGADLREADLQKTDLIGADLREANLQKTDLQGADLREADLRETKNLETAFLSGAEYNDETKFPAGFNPTTHGMVKNDDLPPSLSPLPPTAS